MHTPDEINTMQEAFLAALARWEYENDPESILYHERWKYEKSSAG